MMTVSDKIRDNINNSIELYTVLFWYRIVSMGNDKQTGETP